MKILALSFGAIFQKIGMRLNPPPDPDELSDEWIYNLLMGDPTAWEKDKSDEKEPWTYSLFNTKQGKIPKKKIDPSRGYTISEGLVYSDRFGNLFLGDWTV